MSLRFKFVLGVIIVFAILAASIAAVSFVWVDQNTVREAQQRVQLYIQSSWEIYNAKLERMEYTLDLLAQNDQVRAALQNPQNETLAANARKYLESVRQSQNMDVLNLMDADGRVLVRTRPPYNAGDVIGDDGVVRRAITSRKLSGGTVMLNQARLVRGGDGLLERCLQYGGEPQGMMLTAAMPIVVNDQLIGVLQMGNLLNGSVEKVDRIRDTVFKNETYNGKPLGTATIFMNDLRISTNVLDAQGNRAIGTRAAPDVALQVLTDGKPWTGRAWVVDTWYLAQYDPIRDPDGKVIGMLYVGELEQKYLDLRTQALALFLSIILAGMLLAFIVFFTIARSIVAPIEKLAYATRRLADGDLTYRVSGDWGSSRNEVKQLAISFDEMAAQLQKQRDEIAQDHQALEKLNQDLQTTNRNYMEMLGFVAHELKNPLSSAILNVGTVKDGMVGEVNDTQKEALESVARSLRYFREMIANYLDLSRVEKGELIVNPARIDLRTDVVKPALDSFARAIGEKKMVLDDRVPDEIALNADRNLLRIVYDNLLSNAIKYGREGGKIVLEGHPNGNRQFVLSVCNEGNGIPSDKLPQLFKKFSRLTGPEYARKKGTGLGLYICKEIVEKHGGKIWAESQVGAWTSFVFTVPLAASKNVPQIVDSPVKL